MRLGGRRSKSSRPVRTKHQGPALFVSWGSIAGRTRELANELGAEHMVCHPMGEGPRPPVLVRYLLGTVYTTAKLLRDRPPAVVVTNPPIVLAVLAVLYGAATGATVVLDDHPASFGAQSYRIGKLFEPLHRWAAKRASLCLVTDAAWVGVVEAWGGQALVLHEAPGNWRPAGHALGDPPTVLFVCTFSRDEPAAAAIEAAARVPDVRLLVTGDRGRAPKVPLPANVELVGFLDPAAYRSALEEADAVMALTTEPTSAMRAAFEAVWAERPLIASDWPLTAELFPEAIRVRNEAAAIALGIRQAIEQHERLQSCAPTARSRCLARWHDQIQALRRTVKPAADTDTKPTYEPVVVGRSAMDASANNLRVGGR